MARLERARRSRCVPLKLRYCPHQPRLGGGNDARARRKPPQCSGRGRAWPCVPAPCAPSPRPLIWTRSLDQQRACTRSCTHAHARTHMHTHTHTHIHTHTHTHTHTHSHIHTHTSHPTFSSFLCLFLLAPSFLRPCLPSTPPPCSPPPSPSAPLPLHLPPPAPPHPPAPLRPPKPNPLCPSPSLCPFPVPPPSIPRSGHVACRSRSALAPASHGWGAATTRELAASRRYVAGKAARGLSCLRPARPCSAP
jgi:hypothetical protein